jgi:hypothetical protein
MSGPSNPIAGGKVMGSSANHRAPQPEVETMFSKILAMTAVVAAAFSTVLTAPSAQAAPSPTAAAAAPGTFPLTIDNRAAATYPAAKVFVTILGQATPGHWSYLTRDGVAHPIDHRMASAPGHLTKDGRSFPNMSFNLAGGNTVRIPARFEGARVYISLGSPMYLGVSPDDQGWAGPDLHNPNDPNRTVLFDWYEFTWRNGVIPFGGNTTQVDMLGFPMTARVRQTGTGFDRTTGIALTRKQVFDRYKSAVTGPFRQLETPQRIVAPRTGAPFAVTGASAKYLAPTIDKVWNQWATKGFRLTRLNQTFTGKVQGNQLVFRKDGAGPYVLRKPTSQDVWACAGSLASAGMNTTELELGAEVCAAFNRGVAGDTSQWYRPADYYRAGTGNQYAGFMHSIGLGHRAYGFAYDDVNDQSSVVIAGNAKPPTSVTLTVQPMV